MAILEDLTKAGPFPLLVGLGLVVAAPNVIPAVASGLRPLAKVMVKTALTLFDAVKEGIAEAGEQVNDLVEETRAEMVQQETRGVEGGEVETSTRTRRRRSRG
jgi:hypothetical protein